MPNVGHVWEDFDQCGRSSHKPACRRVLLRYNTTINSSTTSTVEEEHCRLHLSTQIVHVTVAFAYTARLVLLNGSRHTLETPRAAAV